MFVFGSFKFVHVFGVHTQVMGLMQQCGVELEKDSLQTLLRFLVHSHHNEELKSKLINRMYKDKLVPITHKECVALTNVLYNRVDSKSRFIKLANNAYGTENYLFFFPTSHQQVFTAKSAPPTS